MKEHVRVWIGDVKANAEARRRNACRQCGKRPMLGKRDDGQGMRAVHFCKFCQVPAFGSDSYIGNMKAAELASLPLVGAPLAASSQGELL